MSCALYRFYGVDDRLLYIGISTHAAARLAQHANDKDWFPKVTRASFEHYPDRKSAEAAEKAAIKAERPLHNIRHAIDPDSILRQGEMSAAELAAYVRVSVGIVKRWADAGYIPHRRCKDGTPIFRRQAVDKWIRSLRNDAAQETAA